MRLTILCALYWMFSFLPIEAMAADTELRFAMVPKQVDNPFFIASGEGCKAAAAELGNVECIFRGSGNINVRRQDQIISDLIDEGVDGIAVAISQSEYLASHSIQKAISRGIPVITYDADFDPDVLDRYSNLRLAYVGTDDFEIGIALGKQLKKLRPKGGTLVIQSGRPDAHNLNLRVMGLRSALSGKLYHLPPGQALQGENGWTEFNEPFYNYGQFDQAQRELKSVLRTYRIKKINSFVAVGGWTQINNNYRDIVKPHIGELAQKEIVIIVADSSDMQIAYLKEKLAHGNVGQNPFEMGRQAIFTLFKILNNQSYNKEILIPMVNCTQENYSTCIQR